MYGWRARIGIIYPSSGMTDHAYHRLAPEGVSVHILRHFVTRTLQDPEQTASLGEPRKLTELAKVFVALRVHCITWACTGGSFMRGYGADKEQIEAITEATGIPASTTSTGMVAGARALGLHKLAVAASYQDEYCVRLRDFLEKSGFVVDNLVNAGILDHWDLSSKKPEFAYTLGREADTPDADGVFIPDTAIRTIEIIEALEQDLGKPVVTANQATMWHALRTAGINAPIERFGKLMLIS
jgi:maleate isomerase